MKLTIELDRETVESIETVISTPTLLRDSGIAQGVMLCVLQAMSQGFPGILHLDSNQISAVGAMASLGHAFIGAYATAKLKEERERRVNVKRHPPRKPGDKPRTRSQVMRERWSGSGCCNAFNDNQACDCLTNAEPD